MAIECETALAWMMEAEPAELAGASDTELSAHLKTCPRCAVVAARLVEGQAELERALGELGPRTGADEAVVRLRSTRRRGLGRVAWRVALPVAAAAALVGVLFLRPTRLQQLPGSDVPVVERWEERPFVEPQTNKNVLVFETRDRSAKVIWFY